MCHVVFIRCSDVACTFKHDVEITAMDYVWTLFFCFNILLCYVYHSRNAMRPRLRAIQIFKYKNKQSIRSRHRHSSKFQVVCVTTSFLTSQPVGDVSSTNAAIMLKGTAVKKTMAAGAARFSTPPRRP